jgi:large conductance mechanosensitive channel
VFQEFRDFINKGNVVDIAVAFVMGAAFNAVVSALTERIVMPLAAMVIRLDGIEQLGRFGENGSVGAFIQAVLNFLIIGFVMFLIVKAYNQFRETDEPSGPPEDIALLREIRDELQAARGQGPR